ncbi:MAG: hypothetical protein K6C38_01255 [Saccharofermentans sp.]|nr:hypothetical protein [Saccharofermentans sp.]
MLDTIMNRRSYRGKYKADGEPVMPKKKTFEERAWFNSLPDSQRQD